MHYGYEETESYDEKLDRVQKNVETALLEQTQSVIKERRDVWKSIMKLERETNDVKAKLSLLYVDFENTRGKLSAGGKKDPKQFYKTTGNDHYALKAEVSELTRRLTDLEFLCKGSSLNTEDLKEVETKRKPSISGRLAIIEETVISNLQKGTVAFGTTHRPGSISDSEGNQTQNPPMGIVPRRPSVNPASSPKYNANSSRRRSSSASSFSPMSPVEGSPKPSTSPGNNQFKVELRRLTSYVQELWQRDQDKFSDLIEVFQAFNNRISRVEKVLEKNGFIQREDGERQDNDDNDDNDENDNTDSDRDSVKGSLQSLKENMPKVAKEKNPKRNEDGNENSKKVVKEDAAERNYEVEMNGIVNKSSKDRNEEKEQNNFEEQAKKSADDIRPKSQGEASTLYDIDVEGKNDAEASRFKYAITEKEKALEEMDSLKASKKLKIVNWVADFTARHGAEPSLADKNEVRDMYIEYKEVSREKKEIVEELRELREACYRLE